VVKRAKKRRREGGQRGEGRLQSQLDVVKDARVVKRGIKRRREGGRIEARVGSRAKRRRSKRRDLDNGGREERGGYEVGEGGERERESEHMRNVCT